MYVHTYVYMCPYIVTYVRIYRCESVSPVILGNYGLTVANDIPKRWRFQCLLHRVSSSVIASGQPNKPLFGARLGSKVGPNSRAIDLRNLCTKHAHHRSGSRRYKGHPTSNTSGKNPCISSCWQSGKVDRTESTVQRLDRAVGKFEQNTEDDPGDNDGGE